MLKIISFFFISIIFLFTGCSNETKTQPLETKSPQQTQQLQTEQISNDTTLKAIGQNISTDEDVSKTITLTAEGADEKNLTYIVVTQPLHGILTGKAPDLTYIPNHDFHGKDDFTFRVVSGKSASAPASVKIEINSVNDAPVAVLKLKKSKATIDQIEKGDIINALGSYDLDGQVVSYKFYDNNQEIMQKDKNLATPCLNKPGCYELSVGMHTISLVVIDNEGKQSANTPVANLLVMQKLKPNEKPIVDAGEDKTTSIDTPVTLTSTASDSDGMIVSYKWTEGEKVLSSSLSFDYLSSIIGEHILKLTVTDNRWGKSSDEVIVTVTDISDIQNKPPIVSAGKDVVTKVGKSVSLDANATDSDGTIVSYKWTQNGKTLSTDAVLEYTPLSVGEHIIKLIVTDDDGISASDEVIVTAIETNANECSSSLQSENDFTDIFVQQNHDDISFFASKNSSLGVKDIAAAFNYARSQDSTISKPLKMPDQSTWDQMSESKKALYLINSERCARGIRAFEGIEPEVVNQVSVSYAQFIATHESEFEKNPHEADGRTPWERLEQDAGVAVNKNADFFKFAENLAYQAVGSSDDYPIVYAPTVKSVYAWLYEDKGSNYGHRDFILATGLVDNSGENGSEGLIGLGQATENYTTISGDATLYWTKVHTVLNAFDPNKNWDMSNVVKNKNQ